MTSRALTFWNLPETLIERFPEIGASVGEVLAAEHSAGGRPYPHAFLEEYFFPLLVNSCAETGGLARRGFKFLEEMLLSGDEDLIGAVLLNVVEALAGDEQRLAAAWPQMGEQTRRWAIELAGGKRPPTPSPKPAECK